VAVLRRKANSGPLQAALALSFDRGGKLREWPGVDLLEAELGRSRFIQDPALIRRGRPSRRDLSQLIADEYRGVSPWVPRQRDGGAE
jgi:hypothetical protein